MISYATCSTCLCVILCQIVSLHTIMYRSGTEEEYSEMQQLLEDIISYNTDFVGAKELKKEKSKKKYKEDKKKGMEMRQAAMEGQRSIRTAFIFYLFN